MNVWAYRTGVDKRDKPLLAFAKAFGAKDLGPDCTYKGGLSLIWGFGSLQEAMILRCMRGGMPFFHFDHAYFKRGYENGNFRVNFGHFHQTRLLDVPYVRTPLATKRLQPWKTDGRQVVVVVPSERICMVLSALHGRTIQPKEWARQTEALLKQHTDRPLVRKEKGGSMLDVLRGAHACVSLSSVAEVEAAVFGVPVFVTPDSPAAPVSQMDLSKIESPIYPDRYAWLKTLSFSQFHISEAPKAVGILREIYAFNDLRAVANGDS